MKEKMKSLKMDVTFSAILSVVIGILFVFCAADVSVTIARIIAIILMAVGVVNFIGQLMNPIGKYMGMVISLVIALVGLWILLSPTIIIQIIPIIIGVILVVHGVQDVALAMEAKRNQGDNWWIILIMALINAIFGIYCICNAFGLAKLGIIIIGIMMIYDGLTDMFIVHKVNRAAKDVVADAEIVHEEDVDDFL